MDIRNKMKPQFANVNGGLFLNVAKADVGGGYLEMGKRGVALLGWADPFYPDPAFPEHVQKALIEAIQTGFPAHYTPPAGDETLKKEIAGRLKRFNGLDVDPMRNILVTPGSDAGLFYSMFPFIDKDDEVMILDPSYPNNFQNVSLMGGKAVGIPLLEENNFQPKIDDFEKRLTPNTKMVLLTNPNNPTTTVLRKKFIHQLAEFIIRNDLVCVVDQAFEDSVYDGIEFVTIAAFPGMFERTVTVFSLSKGMALSGIRVGYIVACDKVMDVLYGAAVAVIGATNTASQKAAIVALRNDGFIAEYNKIFDRRRKMAYEIFNKIPGVKMLMPESGFFSWINVSSLGTGDEIAARLMEKGIAVVNGGSAYGSQGKGYIRLIQGSMKDDLQLKTALVRIAGELDIMSEEKGIVPFKGL